MKNFLRENWLWLVSILFFTTLFLLLLFGKDGFEPWLIELLKKPFQLIGIITIIYGGCKALEKAGNEFVDNAWQAGFLLFLIVFSLCLTCNIIKF